MATTSSSYSDPLNQMYSGRVSYYMGVCSTGETMSISCDTSAVPIEWTSPGSMWAAPVVQPRLPDIEFCAYCGAEYFSSKYHPGCCGECGAPRRRQ